MILQCAPNPCQNHHELFTVIGWKRWFLCDWWIICCEWRDELNLRVHSKKQSQTSNVTKVTWLTSFPLWQDPPTPNLRWFRRNKSPLSQQTFRVSWLHVMFFFGGGGVLQRAAQLQIDFLCYQKISNPSCFFCFMVLHMLWYLTRAYCRL